MLFNSLENKINPELCVEIGARLTNSHMKEVQISKLNTEILLEEFLLLQKIFFLFLKNVIQNQSLLLTIMMLLNFLILALNYTI